MPEVSVFLLIMAIVVSFSLLVPLFWLPGRSRKAFYVSGLYVIDGDTVAKDDLRIRLAGIDAPEMDQPGGQDAKTHLRRLTGRGRVRVKPVETDRYGRLVARLETSKGDVCRKMVSDGYAIAAYGRAYRSDEKAARARRRGLWAKGGISSPSAHRRKTRK